MSWVEIRCSCHRLIMKASSTSSGRVEILCPRCKEKSILQWSTRS